MGEEEMAEPELIKRAYAGDITAVHCMAWPGPSGGSMMCYGRQGDDWTGPDCHDVLYIAVN